MPDQPLVSVLISTFNHEPYIAECLDSVLAQKDVSFEIVVCDDASSDRTPAIASDYASRYPTQVVAILNKSNAGIVPVWNSLLARSTGKYLATFSGDDVMLPGKLQAQVAAMEADDSVALVYHDVEAFHSELGSTLYYANHGLGSHKPHAGDARAVLWHLIATGNSFIGATSVLLRASRVPQPGFERRLRVVADWYMWICVLAEAGANAKVAFIPQVLSRYRRHSRNVSNVLHVDDIAVTLALVESRYPHLLDAVRIARARLYYWMGTRLFRANDVQSARRYLVASLRTGFATWKAPLRLLQCLVAGVRRRTRAPG